MAAKNLFIDDIVTFCVVALALANMGFSPLKDNLLDRKRIRKIDGHKIYTVIIRLRDDEVFDTDKFSSMLRIYSQNCRVKPLFFTTKEVRCKGRVYFTSTTGKRQFYTMDNFHDLHVQVCV